MIRSKKKKLADKDKKAKKKVASNERETVFYEQQIIDNNQVIMRLQTRNDYLENEMKVLKEKLEKLKEDRNDIVAHLKKNLHNKNEETQELLEHLVAIEELRKEEQNDYITKEDIMKLEYHNMETNLNAELKLVTGKLNALEDWRNARAELTKKFEIQEEQMAKQNEDHAKALYDAEKSLIIEKSKMQKEMEQHLSDLTLEFENAMNTKIADTTKRAIQENIALNKELNKGWIECQKLSEKLEILKEKDRCSI